MKYFLTAEYHQLLKVFEMNCVYIISATEAPAARADVYLIDCKSIE